MIFNRPSNLWLAASVAIFNILALYLVFTSAQIVAVNIALAAVIALIAGQPPIVNTGDSVVVKTNNGHTDKRITFSESGDATTTPIAGTDHPKEPKE